MPRKGNAVAKSFSSSSELGNQTSGGFPAAESFANLRDTHKCKRKMFPYCHRIFFLIGLAFSLLALLDAKCAADPVPGDLGGVGTVEFPVACETGAQCVLIRL